MAAAEVGDDVFGLDPTVNKLQERVATMFGMEAAIFCPSGTMTNQLALKVHTRPLDEVICDETSHIYQYETAGYAYNSGIGVNLIKGNYGKITPDQIKAAVKPRYDWLPISRLVVLENSTNKGGGNYYTTSEIQAIKETCDSLNLRLHLDGARLFNVLAETNESTEEVGALFDSISICISKGLGAPVGSLLIGTTELVTEARRFRKVMGGGMRQAGILAAACLYALDNNVDRLRDDNQRARELGEFLESLPYVEGISPVKTNILIFTLKSGTADDFVKTMSAKKVTCAAFGPKHVRFVTHMDFTSEMLEELKTILANYKG